MKIGDLVNDQKALMHLVVCDMSFLLQLSIVLVILKACLLFLSGISIIDRQYSKIIKDGSSEESHQSCSCPGIIQGEGPLHQNGDICGNVYGREWKNS